MTKYGEVALELEEISSHEEQEGAPPPPVQPGRLDELKKAAMATLADDLFFTQQKESIKRAWEQEWNQIKFQAESVDAIYQYYLDEIAIIFNQLLNRNSNLQKLARLYPDDVTSFPCLLNRYRASLIKELEHFQPFLLKARNENGREINKDRIDHRKFRHAITAARALKTLNDNIELGPQFKPDVFFRQLRAFTHYTEESGISPQTKIATSAIVAFVLFSAVMFIASVACFGIPLTVAGLGCLLGIAMGGFGMPVGLMVKGEAGRHYKPVVRAKEEGNSTAVWLLSIFNRGKEENFKQVKDEKAVPGVSQKINR